MTQPTSFLSGNYSSQLSHPSFNPVAAAVHAIVYFPISLCLGHLLPRPADAIAVALATAARICCLNK